MKRLELPVIDQANHEDMRTWWEYVREKLLEAGFSEGKNYTQHFSTDYHTIVFTQED